MTRRDDLESLAYSLFHLLRGSLPWDRPHVHTSTPKSVRRHVHAKKRAWSGARLAEGYNEAFGQFLDGMRNLGFDETPPYDRWRCVYADISDRLAASLPFDYLGNIAGKRLVLARLLTETQPRPHQPKPHLISPITRHGNHHLALLSLGNLSTHRCCRE